jgi:hypothetical protein
MLHLCVTFLAGRYIFYDGNKLYFCFLHSFLSFGYGKICFEFTHFFYNRPVTAVLLTYCYTGFTTMSLLFLTFITPNLKFFKHLGTKHKLFVFKLNTDSLCLINTIS